MIVPPEEKDGSLSFLSSHSPNKNASPHGEKGKTETQRIVDDLGEIFVRSVAENRGITEEEVLKNYGQGSVFVGPDALKRGMIDDISTIEEILSTEEKTKVNAGKIKEEHPEAYTEIFNLGAQSIDQEKIRGEAVQESEKKERERVTGILELEGSQATTKQMIAEGRSVGEAAVAFRKEELKQGGTSPGAGALQQIIEAEDQLQAPSAAGPSEPQNEAEQAQADVAAMEKMGVI